MLNRCRNPNQQNYYLYGGRGITVCDRWLKFEHFLADMGEKLPGMTLDRKDNEGNYEPSNCRWVDIHTQANNKRNNHVLTLDGFSLTIAQWARKTGLKRTTILERINTYGWTTEQALTLPTHHVRRAS
jgi:hypothetical protein